MLQAMKKLIDLGADPEETAGGWPSLPERLNNTYTRMTYNAICPEVDKILREYRRKTE